MYNMSSCTDPESVSALGPTDGNKETKKEEVTYYRLKCHTLLSTSQKKQTLTSKDRKEPSRPPLPWRFIAAILGVLCLALLVALSVSISLVLQASNEVAEQNKTLLKQQEVRNNHTQLRESLKNCMQQKKDHQDQYKTLADALKKKEESCGHCAKSWIQHGERCYHFSEKMRTWPDSKKYCSSQGSSLLKIGDKKELDFITGLACMQWIGLSHKNISYSWTWEDGAVHSTHLFPVRPVQDGGTCALFHSGNALAYNCAEVFRCICEKPAV